MRFLNEMLVVILCLTSADAFTQSGKVPPFRIVQADGRVFMAQNLPVGKPIVIIYFSPECEECQKLTAAMLSRIDELSDVSIAMITYQPRENIAGYIKKNNLDRYGNIFAGTEFPTLLVRDYYNIMHFPYMVLYDKNGNLIKKYTDKEVSINDVISRSKQLK